MSKPALENATPFHVEISEEKLQTILRKVREYPWPADAAREGWVAGWELGVSLPFLESLCGYWISDYDWRAWETKLNRFPQFLSKQPGGDIHFYLERGSGSTPTPLMLLHGWPGSIFEFLHLIEPLAHPERFGGNIADAFTVVVPSLPGYGFSGVPQAPIGPREIARRMNTLMTGTLGFERYLVQGGDWGSLIGGWLGYEAPGCVGLHLNMMGWDSPGVTYDSAEERTYASRVAAIVDDGLGYAHQQRTRPQTLSIAMRDSPVGVCGWIIEKFHGWSDSRRGFENVFTQDQLLTNVMIYLVTDTFNTAAWAYKGRLEERRQPQAPLGARIETPTAIANFPREFLPFPPRSFVERSINVARWTDFAEGGHFPALERPTDMLQDIRAFAQSLRDRPH